MEFDTRRNLYRKATVLALAGTALLPAGCSGISIDSYLTDPSNVQCDGKRTKVDLNGNGEISFIVLGKQKDDAAIIAVRRKDDLASIKVSGDVTGPPQVLEEDGYTAPVPVGENSSIGTFGADGAWIVELRNDSVVIRGSCDGM